MGEKTTDQALVERVQAGDKKAFDILVLKYQQRVMKVLSRYVRDQAELEDLAQEAFIKAYRALPRFRGDSAFYTWLYRIAINTAKNFLVAQDRRPPADDIDASDGDEIQQVISEAIDDLPDDLKTAITLRELEGMSYEEIADAMDCPIGTVRSRIFRAREAVDAKLKPLLG